MVLDVVLFSGWGEKNGFQKRHQTTPNDTKRHCLWPSSLEEWDHGLGILIIDFVQVGFKVSIGIFLKFEHGQHGHLSAVSRFQSADRCVVQENGDVIFFARFLAGPEKDLKTCRLESKSAYKWNILEREREREKNKNKKMSLLVSTFKIFSLSSQHLSPTEPRFFASQTCSKANAIGHCPARPQALIAAVVMKDLSSELTIWESESSR